MHRYINIPKQIFGYYQNKSFEILEILTEEKLVVGFVKTNFNLEFDCNLLLESINKLKPTLFNVVKIPVFNVKTKLRLKSLLLELNVKTIFMDLNIPELFKSRTCLDDILQNFEFDIGSKIVQKKEISNNGEISSKEFIIDSSFIYYVKVPKINLILMMGIY
jgi:serine protease inhibitor